MSKAMENPRDCDDRGYPYPCIQQRDLLQQHNADLAKLTVALGHLTQEVTTLTTEVREVKDNHLAPMVTRIAVQEVQLTRLSWIVYGCAAGLAGQVLVTISALGLWIITTKVI